MSYLDRLVQIEQRKIFAYTPEPELTKLPKAPFVSSGSTPQGPYVKTQSANAESGQVTKVGAGETASVWWLIHYADRDPVETSCTPPATLAEILASTPAAIAAEPFEPTIRQPSTSMTAEDEAAIRAWLALIEETDPATIAEVTDQCQQDEDARGYFLSRAAAELPTTLFIAEANHEKV